MSQNNKKLNFLTPLKKIGIINNKPHKKYSNADSVSSFDIDEQGLDPFYFEELASTYKVAITCSCCGCTNYINSSSNLFKCNTCSVKNYFQAIENSIDEPSEYEHLMSFLNPKFVESELAKFKASGKLSYSFQDNLFMVFSLSTVLNKGFLVNYQNYLDPYKINWASVRMFYKLLLSFPPQVKKSLMEGTLKALLDPKIYVTSRRDIRYMLILLENPIFRHSSSNPQIYSILKRLFGTIVNTKKRFSDSILFSIRERESSALQYYTTVAKSFIYTTLRNYLPKKDHDKKPKKRSSYSKRHSKKPTIALNQPHKKGSNVGIINSSNLEKLDFDVAFETIHQKQINENKLLTKVSRYEDEYNSSSYSEINDDISYFKSTDASNVSLGDMVICGGVIKNPQKLNLNTKITPELANYPVSVPSNLNAKNLGEFKTNSPQKSNNIKAANNDILKNMKTDANGQDNFDLETTVFKTNLKNSEFQTNNTPKKKSVSSIKTDNVNYSSLNGNNKNQLFISDSSFSSNNGSSPKFRKLSLKTSSENPFLSENMKNTSHSPVKTPTKLNFLSDISNGSHSEIQIKSNNPFLKPRFSISTNDVSSQENRRITKQKSLGAGDLLKIRGSEHVNNVPLLSNSSKRHEKASATELFTSAHTNQLTSEATGKPYNKNLAQITSKPELRKSIIDGNFMNGIVAYKPQKPAISCKHSKHTLRVSRHYSTNRSSYTRKEVLVEKPAEQKRRTSRGVYPDSSDLDISNLDYIIGNYSGLGQYINKKKKYKEDWGLFAAFKFMKMLYIANLLRPKNSRIPFSSFVFDSLGKFNLYSDYLEWKKSKGDKQANKNNNCIVEYSFLLDLESKLNILQSEAQSQMNMQVNNALLDAFFAKEQRLSQESIGRNRDSEGSILNYSCEFLPFGNNGMISEIISSCNNLEQSSDRGNASGSTNRVANRGSDTGTNREASNLMTSRFKKVNLLLNVRRDCLADDSLTQISKMQSEVKKPLRIKFVEEEGIDAGGLTKEFFMLLIKEILNLDNGMFTLDPESKKRAIWFNPASGEDANLYYLFGVTLGLALYNGVILDLSFPRALYKKLLDPGVYDIHSIISKSPLEKPPKQIYSNLEQNKTTILQQIASMLPDNTRSRFQLQEMIDDIGEFNPSLSNGFRSLLEYGGNDLEDVFCLSFEATYSNFGTYKSVPLIPNEENVQVTQENKFEYVQRYCHFWLQEGISKQFDPFRRGFYFVCGNSALEFFYPDELETLLSGSNKVLTFNELEPLFVFHEIEKSDPLVGMLFEILKSFDNTKLEIFLFFVTGCYKLPSSAHPPISIKVILLGDDERRLPVARTCFNQLGLFRYSSLEIMKEKLLMAIYGSEGFDLK
ncbi:hypothetical protein BB560_003106 [Smittium megazygosporum]|uniref:HECT-type E3 ubiquitin transferase n=1 Tax=Smittium megazygosporum TaxID=133381 RepID=A0A2T9ZD15_9FUNG|nr:hypothetical protein BB560_003106 [Smittium megazygosporum]